MANQLFLKKTANYNNIPVHMIPEMPEDGTVAIFQSVNIISDPFGGARAQTERSQPVRKYAETEHFAPIGKVKDPKSGEWIKIGLISYEDKEGRPVCEGDERELLNWRPNENGGYYRLTIGRNSLTDAMYQYLMLSSEVSENGITEDCRDQHVNILVRYVDEEREARKKRAKQDAMLDAAEKAKQLTPDKMAQVGYLLGYTTKVSPDTVRAGVIDYAMNNPESFMKLLDDPKYEIKSRVQEAITLGVIYVDSLQRALRWNDNSQREILKLSSIEIEKVREDYVMACVNKDFQVIDNAIANEISIRKAAKDSPEKKTKK